MTRWRWLPIAVLIFVAAGIVAWQALRAPPRAAARRRARWDRSPSPRPAP